MRALWAASTAAITASALVGVLLGAYLHEQRVNERLTSTDKAPVTSVHIQISTITVSPNQLPATSSESEQPTAELVTRESEEGTPEPSSPRSTPETTPPAPSGALPTTTLSTTTLSTTTPPTSSSQPPSFVSTSKHMPLRHSSQ